MRTPSTYCGTIISGEAPESDDGEFIKWFCWQNLNNVEIFLLLLDLTSLSSISGAMDAMACPPYTDLKISKSKKSSIKYNSLLHKKLRKLFNN